MAGLCFKTSGVAGLHLLTEQITRVSSPTRFRVVFRNLPFAVDGSSVTGAKLGVGVDKELTTVLLAPSTTLVDSILVHNVNLNDICWNDFGTVCVLSLTWEPEKWSLEPSQGPPAPQGGTKGDG